MQSRFTSKAQEALNYAADTAAMLGHGYIGSEHLLIGLIKAEGGLASSVLLNNDVTDEKIINLVCQLIAPDSVVNVKEPSGYTPRVRRILDNAAREAARFKSELIGTEHILIAIIKETDSVASRLLNTIGVPVKKMYVDLLMAMGEDAGKAKEDFQNGRPRGNDRKSTATLDQYSRDLTQMAREGRLDPVIGREEEIGYYIPVETVLPAPAQGALAIEIRENDEKIYDLIRPIEDRLSQMQIEAERAFLDGVEGSCHLPIGAYAELEEERMKLTCLLGDEEGVKMVKEILYRACTTVEEARNLGYEAAKVILEKLQA